MRILGFVYILSDFLAFANRKKIIEKDTRLFLRISTELKTKIQLKAKAQNIPISIFVMDAIDFSLPLPLSFKSHHFLPVLFHLGNSYLVV